MSLTRSEPGRYDNRGLCPAQYEFKLHIVDVYRLKITAAGQMSIPAALRKRWNVDEVLVIDKGDYALVRPAPADAAEELRGSLPTDGQPSEQMRDDERLLEQQKEADRWSSSTQ